MAKRPTIRWRMQAKRMKFIDFLASLVVGIFISCGFSLKRAFLFKLYIIKMHTKQIGYISGMPEEMKTVSTIIKVISMYY